MSNHCQRINQTETSMSYASTIQPFLRTLSVGLVMVAVCVQPLILLASLAGCQSTADLFMVTTSNCSGCCCGSNDGSNGVCCDSEGCDCAVQETVPVSPPAIPPTHEPIEVPLQVVVDSFPMDYLPLVPCSRIMADLTDVSPPFVHSAQQTCVLLSRFTC